MDRGAGKGYHYECKSIGKAVGVLPHRSYRTQDVRNRDDNNDDAPVTHHAPILSHVPATENRRASISDSG